MHSEKFDKKMSRFEINDNKLNPFTHESKTSIKRQDGELLLLKMNTSSNDEQVELNMLKSSARQKFPNTEIKQDNRYYMD